MGANLAVTTAEFEEKVLKSPIPVMIDFWAEWCGPCKQIGPSVEQLAAEYAGKMAVYKVDIESDGDLASRYGIMSIPTLFIFKDGKVADQMVGAAKKEQIAAFMDRSLK